MNTLDIVALAFLFIFGYTGYRKGLIYSAFVSARFLLSVITTHIFMKIFYDRLILDSTILKIVESVKVMIFRRVYLNPALLENIEPSLVIKVNYYILFVILFIVISTLAVILSIILRPAVKNGVIKEVDKIFGSVFGVMRFILISMLIVFIFDKIPDAFISFDLKEFFSESIYLKYMYVFNIFIYFFG